MLAHQVLQSITTEPLAADRREQWPITVTAFAYPDLDQLGRIATKRRAAFFPSLANAADVSAGPKNCVPAAQIDQFRRPQSSLKRKQQQGVITAPHPRRSIRRGE